MRQFRFAREIDTVVVEASNRHVAEKRAKRALETKGIDAIANVLVSCPENLTVKKHYPTGEIK